MSGPWDKYAAPEQGPWARYAPEKPRGLVSRIVNALPDRMVGGGPMGMLTSAAVSGTNDALERGAYEAGGRVTDATGSPALGTAANVAVQAIPMALGGGTGSMVGSGVKPALRSGAEWMMRSALKPSVPDMLSGKGPRAINTLLERGENVSRGGITSMARDKAKVAGQVLRELDNASTQLPGAPPATVSKTAAGAPVLKEVARIDDANYAGTASDARAQAQKVFDDFQKNASIPEDIPVLRAQRIKQELHKMLDQKYGPHVPTTSTQDAQKALARGLRTGIEGSVPSVAPLNAELGELINALKVTSRRNAVAGNKDPIALASLASNPAAAATFMATRSEYVKSLLARLLNQSSRAAPVAGGLAGAGVGAAYGSSD